MDISYNDGKAVKPFRLPCPFRFDTELYFGKLNFWLGNGTLALRAFDGSKKIGLAVSASGKDCGRNTGNIALLHDSGSNRKRY